MFCGDDGVFITSNSIAKYIRDVIIPRYFIVGEEQDHGTGTVVRDFVIGPIEEHAFLSKHFFDIDNHIYAAVDFKRMLTKLQIYNGSNRHI